MFGRELGLPRNGERQYPPYIRDDGERRRWDLCIVVAMQSFDEDQETAAVWQATRALYFSDIPTDP